MQSMNYLIVGSQRVKVQSLMLDNPTCLRCIVLFQWGNHCFKEQFLSCQNQLKLFDLIVYIEIKIFWDIKTVARICVKSLSRKANCLCLAAYACQNMRCTVSIKNTMYRVVQVLWKHRWKSSETTETDVIDSWNKLTGLYKDVVYLYLQQ